ncbi:rhodanese-like domain-containing protein [Aestuariivivens sp. NBU2969]|uniref:rhodanese-like domain-containing protein n=1 Tax=Aestuariivivens sp. NBU2969 TaxID=2873267 RepID=UPI001CBD0DC1|nr:rhodanese-like domain-containing protein [Aestuariivivens sp. NBU2969]
MGNLMVLVLLFVFKSYSQETLSELLNIYNNKSVPYISVQELATSKTKTIVLDARELKEFEISHIKDAIHVGFDSFNLKSTIQKFNDKQQTIVVYCSLGVRSEDIAEQLKKAGYSKVKNLYGGIFEWKNNGFPIYNLENKETDSIHTFSMKWSKWLKKGIKVYD